MQKKDQSRVDHYPDLYRYAYSLCKHRETAEDAAQDALLAWVKSDLKPTNPKPWLFRVCRNRLIDRIRRKAPSPMTEAIDQKTSEMPSPSESFEVSEFIRALPKLLAGLPENQQEVIRLKFQAHMSYKNIAEVTDSTVGAVGVLLHRAMQSLRQNYKI